jgi:hypothetical protein
VLPFIKNRFTTRRFQHLDLTSWITRILSSYVHWSSRTVWSSTSLAHLISLARHLAPFFTHTDIDAGSPDGVVVVNVGLFSHHLLQWLVHARRQIQPVTVFRPLPCFIAETASPPPQLQFLAMSMEELTE